LPTLASLTGHAVRIDVKPAEASAAVQTEQVFVATVYDEEGNPCRNCRVEWSLEGSGNIVEVDDSNILPGWGHKVDNKFAVTHTSRLEHTISRGNGNPAGDFVIQPGQTWCAINSAIEGETKLTLSAPDIKNWDKRRLVVSTHWADANWRLPPPAVSRYGTQQ